MLSTSYDNTLAIWVYKESRMQLASLDLANSALWPYTYDNLYELFVLTVYYLLLITTEYIVTLLLNRVIVDSTFSPSMNYRIDRSIYFDLYLSNLRFLRMVHVQVYIAAFGRRKSVLLS